MFSLLKKATEKVGLLNLRDKIANIDYILVAAVLVITLGGFSVLYSFSEENIGIERQILSGLISISVLLIFSFIDFRFLRKTSVIVFLFLCSIIVLLLLVGFGEPIKGSRSWFQIGIFSFQPIDMAKVVLIILLAKYFSKRHVEIRNLRHILASGAYALILTILVLLQPDFGGAMIIILIWFGMILVSGISKRHLLSFIFLSFLLGSIFWNYVFEDYQRARIMTFIHPLTDIQGSGYNAYQSTIAVGSGEILGKGVGQGSQSRLLYLPEYETDFIFAAFAEEWGFIGIIILISLYGIVIYRIIKNASLGETNFETFFGLGVSIMFMSHIFIHAGMNVGLLPVTGVTIPFMSYGGSHLLAEYASLGILIGMRKYNRASHRSSLKNEFLGISENLPAKYL